MTAADGTRSMPRLGLLGGSFNPIHFGHLIGARAAAEQLGLDRVILIPSAIPPHKPRMELAAAEHRLAMARAAVAGDALFEVDDLELRRHRPSYTFDTVTELRQRLGGDAQLFWMIGGDSLPELATWHRVAELVDLVDIVTLARPGFAAPRLDALRQQIGAARVERLLAWRLTTPEIQVSASDIRRRLAEGRSIRYLTPDAVIDYIDRNGLYRPETAVE